jgi:acyl-CoA synthetase (AMP-forming)/AMP-acid ligase II
VSGGRKSGNFSSQSDDFLPDFLLHPGARLIDAASGETVGGADLRGRVTEVAARLGALPPGAVFARTSIDVASILRYLGAFAAGRAVALLDPSLEGEVLADLMERFRPAAVLGTDGEPPPGYATGSAAGAAWVRRDPGGTQPHPDLAVLLATSGSTGNPKMVRLSRSAVLANARSIAEALGIGEDEVAPTTLPLHYSYGLSVLNSHLVAGAAVLVDGSGLMARTFWQSVDAHGATSLAGVPYHYEILRRLRFSPAAHPALRTLTQAGGALRPDLVAEFAALMHEAGGRLFVMYGQTEATARMAVLPPDRLGDRPGSAGVPIPGGSFTIVEGEIVYRGPNVMMGYAEGEAELASGDDLGGVLRTGDLGHLDGEGFLHVTGRLKRMGKVFGVRVNLDDVERWLGGCPGAAVVPGDDRIAVFLVQADDATRGAAARELAARLHTRSDAFDVRTVEALPRLPNGKVDYRLLEAQLR